MKNTQLIQKKLVASEPFKKHSTAQWVCNVFDETPQKSNMVCTVYGVTKQEAENAAIIFVKAWDICNLANDILTGNHSD